LTAVSFAQSHSRGIENFPLLLVAAALGLLLSIAIVGGTLEVLLAAFCARIIGAAADRHERTRRS
jgi:hypothetical protein